MSDFVTLTEDKLSQLEDALKEGYDNLFHHNSKPKAPKDKTLTDTIKNHFRLIAMTVVGTMILMKVGSRYEVSPSPAWFY